MTRGWDENHVAIDPSVTNEADQHHYHGDDTGIHQMHRRTKHGAANYFRMILSNDDRARTMHTVAARTDRDLLPTIVAALLDCNDQRRADRAEAWRQHTAQTCARETAYQRITATTQQAAQRQRSRDQRYGLELEFGENASVTTILAMIIWAGVGSPLLTVRPRRRQEAELRFRSPCARDPPPRPRFRRIAGCCHPGSHAKRQTPT